MGFDTSKICVGDQVYVRPTGNASFRWAHQCRYGTITKIRGQYFYVVVPRNTELRFEVSTGKFARKSTDDCNAGYDLYPSEQAYLEHMAAYKKKSKIFSYFRNTANELIPDDIANEIYEIMLKNRLFPVDEE